eukprot:844033_1
MTHFSNLVKRANVIITGIESSLNEVLDENPVNRAIFNYLYPLVKRKLEDVIDKMDLLDLTKLIEMVDAKDNDNDAGGGLVESAADEIDAEIVKEGASSSEP